MLNLQPLVLYAVAPFAASANPWKVAFILEELSLPYEFKKIEALEMKKQPFLSMNPNGKSGAIIDYLIDIYDPENALHYISGPEKHLTRCWEHFQMSGQGPYFGQMVWYTTFHQETLPSVIQRYGDEIKRFLGVIDAHLGGRGTDYLVGDRVTYADIMFLPYCKGLATVIYPDLDTSKWKNYTAWIDRISARPAIARALKVMDAAVAKHKTYLASVSGQK
ncbi:glutathione-s-transferase theta, gst [Trichoderma arundinaceum]|uniref:Glutathione-s-transferase theta, gst n=1 Tax=Trichoderma arundinaceum TaxID=490622 RepID=A0A395NX49_TRIAR|nr:glutathione-s-transferase theta, gst [Trichoderma arundinaceum]